MRRIALFLSALFFVASTAYALVLPVVTVNGAVATPDGSTPSAGTIVCTLSQAASATTGGGVSDRVASRTTGTIGAAGAVTMTIVANDIMTPAGTSYSCRFTITAPISATWNEIWYVTSSPSTVNVGAITRLNVVPGLTLPAITGTAGTAQVSSGVGGLTPSTWTLPTTGSATTWSKTTRAGATYGPSDLAVDVTGDATPDAYITPWGVTWADGRITGPTAIAVITGDSHNEDWTSEWVAAMDAVGLRGTIFVQRSTDDITGTGLPSYGMSSSLIQSWAQSGHEIAGHSATHDYVGYDTVLGNPDFSTPTYGRYATGTVSVTNGSATVTGSGTSWDVANSGKFNPVWADFRVDTDADGTFSDEVTYKVLYVNGSTTITLSTNYGEANASGKNYELQESLMHARYEVERPTLDLRTALGSNYRTRTWANPGSWINDDDVAQTMKAMFGIEASVTYGHDSARGSHQWANDWGSSLSPLRMTNMPVECNDAYATGLKEHVDSAVDSKAMIVFNTHRIMSDGSCTASNTKLTTFQSLAAYLKSEQAAGRIIIMTMEQAARVARLWANQRDWNMLLNPNFYSALGMVQSRYQWPGWQWQNYAGLTSVTNTSGVLTFTKSSGTATSHAIQYQMLSPGTYYVAVDVDVSAVSAGWARLSLYDPGTDYGDLTSVLDPVWYTSDNGGFIYNGQYSPVLSTVGRKLIMGYFRVPELFNQPIGVALRVESFTGTVAFRNPVLIRREPVDLDTKWGGGNGLKNNSISRADVSDTAGAYDAAFNRLWIPSEDYRSTAPTNHLYADYYKKDTGAGYATRVQYGDISADGILDNYVTGSYYGDVDRDGTVERSDIGGACADTASATTITASNCSVVTITGSTTITAINQCNSANKARRLVVLCGTATAQITDGANLKLAGNFTCTADDSISLVCDGTNWYETSRSAN